LKKEIKLKDHQILTLAVDEIKKDPTNPNVMTLEQTNGLEKSMIQFGRLKYIVVDQNNVLIDGEHRLEIEKAIGTKQVQVIKVEIKDEIDRKIIRETLNQLHGEYDKQKQSNELASIFENKRLDELAELLAKPKEDLEKLITRYNPEIKFAKEEDESKLPSLFDQPAFVKRGEIWQLCRHRLMCGDCTHKDDVAKLMQENKADMVFTDPPYNIGFQYNQYNDDKEKTEYENFCNKWFASVASIDTVVFTPGPRNIHIYEQIQKPNDMGVWYKSNSTSGATFFYLRLCEPILFYGKPLKKRDTDYFDFSRKIDQIKNDVEQKLAIKNIHPAKPTELIKEILVTYSEPEALIYDPFLGSGSTLIACEQTNRVCYGMDIDEHYCSVIIKRWEEYTGQKAVKIADIGGANE